MSFSNYDVVVVGAGAAGLSASIGLARAGFRVAVLEAASYPGAENWSGCVYFGENLASPEILGPTGIEELAWERRLVERGFFATNGHSLLGVTYRDPSAFRHCYTVLRPVYDHHLSQVAARLGVALLNETTAESLIREKEWVIGVATNRGAVYGDLIFLAEGDASHLITREGYERFTDQRETPKFLQGLKQVIEMPEGAIEEIFGVGPEEAVAYEMLIRNGTLAGRNLHLNMGGFVYANRRSLSVGLVLPVDNLNEHFGGDPNLLMEWFLGLPALRPWLKNGQPGVFGAKIIRGGGAKDIPNLIDDGLAVGGAASAIGIDFPYPNFTGPATGMGLLITRAACRIRDEKGSFSRDNLQRHYLEPLQQSHYWQDVEFLRRWPSYVKKTKVFFDRNLDLAFGSAYLWTRPDRWVTTKWINWLRLILQVAGPGHWREMLTDFRHLIRALRLKEVTDRPSLGRLFLDGTINALRDLFHQPRTNLPASGTLRVHYSAGGGMEAEARAPAALERWFGRFSPVLAAAAGKLYTNDDTPLLDKLPSAVRLLIRQVNMLDLLGAAGIGLVAVTCGTVLVGWDRFLDLFTRHKHGKQLRGLYRRYALAARQAVDLTPLVTAASSKWEARLAQLGYQTAKMSHIHLLWPRAIQERNNVVQQGLWHVCPAHVYEARVNDSGQVQVVVNYENCIKCETCWRSSDWVDWARDGNHRFFYPVHSPVVGKVIEAANQAALTRPASPKNQTYWKVKVESLASSLQKRFPEGVNGESSELVGEVRPMLAKLERKIHAFTEALAEEPRTIDRARAEYLEMLARYAQQLAVRIQEKIRGNLLGDHLNPEVNAFYQEVLDLATALTTKAEERSRRTWDQRFNWAAADGRQILQHHVTGIQAFLHMLEQKSSAVLEEDTSERKWLRAEDEGGNCSRFTRWREQLDSAFPTGIWRDLEKGKPLSARQDELLRDLFRQIPVLDQDYLSESLHPPIRKFLLSDLGSRDPSLAFRLASYLWARDLACLAGGSNALKAATDGWTQGKEWACFAALDAVETYEGKWKGSALFVPALGASSLLLLLNDQLVVLACDSPGLRIEPLPTLGLRGAGLARIHLDLAALPETRVAVDHDRIRRVWNILSGADLTSIALGMAEHLCSRTVGHAISRVQFPGLFHDEDALDAIGKFGIIKKMIAEMDAKRYLIETLSHTLSPIDFSTSSLETVSLIKAITAEALGTSPGSLSYNAGQIFGGTGYSEDDTLAKYYRDASAWRFLGLPNVEIYRRHGSELLRLWRPDGQRLAHLPREVELFEELAQRKALLAELDEVRNTRSRLRSLITEWLGAEAERTPAANAEVVETLARQDAYLLASKALLLRTHARFERGLSSEIEASLLRVWLEGSSVSLEECENVVRARLDSAEPRRERPIVESIAGPPVLTYAEYLATPCPYESGNFLSNPLDLFQPRLVPDLVEADDILAESSRGLKNTLSGHFGNPRGEGVPYERYIERQHRPDSADLDFCRKHGFFRMTIKKDLGGEGRNKIDYYFLTTHAQRIADVAISLTIQANSSIGTTPVLLAREKELPKAQKDLAPFVEDSDLHKDIREQLQHLVRIIVHSPSKQTEAALAKLKARLKETVLNRVAVRVLVHRFLTEWDNATQAVKDFDPLAASRFLEEAIAEWGSACSRAEEYHQELGRRREACDQFLRWVVSGQISAFALTEPSAGSDTARVGTRAHLRSALVEEEENGIYRFTPVGEKKDRRLLDAKKLEFRKDEVYYQFSEGEEPARIQFDEYDYETDDSQKLRYFSVAGRCHAFHDIGQLRTRDGKVWYDYWELTGAKMWITNGRMSGIMCLYAKTQEGVTGFIVDRHAEGLLVGKDEEKLGQCGSPTNELSLQKVRVPRENVIGLEGRGQVNALETLNVGRAGIAMSSVAQMPDLIDQSRAFVRQNSAPIGQPSGYEIGVSFAGQTGAFPDWVEWRLQRMEENRFIGESVAYEVIGRFEHPATKSVRMESAIAKMLVSELYHQTIEIAEVIHGLPGQTQLHLVEKRKRDARILNIYEGTNEIQRFTILKDLVLEVAPRWAQPAEAPFRHVGQEALELEALKNKAKQRIDAAIALFGSQVWQNPNLQPSCFLLAEMAAWIKAGESVLSRVAWLSQVENLGKSPQAKESNGAGDPNRVSDCAGKITLGLRSLQRCSSEIQDRLRRFDEELIHLRRGYYAPEIRAARLLFEKARQTPNTAGDERVLTQRIESPLRILLVLEPQGSPKSPNPFVENGCLLEPFVALTESDRSALELALRIREHAHAPVTLEVIAVGPRRYASVLRETLSLGIDRAVLVASENEVETGYHAAVACSNFFGKEPPIDILVGGQEGYIVPVLAEILELPNAGNCSEVTVEKGKQGGVLNLFEEGNKTKVRSLPAAITVAANLSLRTFTLEGYFTGLTKNVEVHRWPRKIPSVPIKWVSHTQKAQSESLNEDMPSLNPTQAAARVLEELGFSGAPVAVTSFGGQIEEVSFPTFLAPSSNRSEPVIVVVHADMEGRLQANAFQSLKAGQVLTDFLSTDMTVLLVCPEDEQQQRVALGQIAKRVQGKVILFPISERMSQFKVPVLKEVWPCEKILPRLIVGESWTKELFPSLQTRTLSEGFIALRVCKILAQDGEIYFESLRDNGKLRTRQALGTKETLNSWIVLVEEAEIEDSWVPKSGQSVEVQRWKPATEKFLQREEIQQLLREVKQDAGVAKLGDADFIIDVGFGVGNRDGYEAVVEPLEKCLRELGVPNLVVGGSRKVTEELHLLPPDKQIGQSGVTVNPKILLALGISGAPQHVNYIGARCTVISFNQDSESPLMTLNQRQHRPRVFAIVGDLFETIPEFVHALKMEDSVKSDVQEAVP